MGLVYASWPRFDSRGGLCVNPSSYSYTAEGYFHWCIIVSEWCLSVDPVLYDKGVERLHSGPHRRTPLIVGGVLIMQEPVTGSVIITLFLLVVLVVSGIVRIVIALRHRELPTWWLLALGGLVSVGVGILLYATMPWSSLWILGTLSRYRVNFRGCWLDQLQSRLRKAAPGCSKWRRHEHDLTGCTYGDFPRILRQARDGPLRSPRLPAYKLPGKPQTTERGRDLIDVIQPALTTADTFAGEIFCAVCTVSERVSTCRLVAWVGDVGALSPTRVPGYAMQQGVTATLRLIMAVL